MFVSASCLLAPIGSAVIRAGEALFISALEGSEAVGLSPISLIASWKVGAAPPQRPLVRESERGFPMNIPEGSRRTRRAESSSWILAAPQTPGETFSDCRPKIASSFLGSGCDSERFSQACQAGRRVCSTRPLTSTQSLWKRPSVPGVSLPVPQMALMQLVNKRGSEQRLKGPAASLSSTSLCGWLNPFRPEPLTRFVSLLPVPHGPGR